MAKKTKAAPVEVPEDDEDLELEELSEDEVEEAPAKSKKGGSDEVAFGASDLAKLASKVTGNTYDAKTVRTLLRRMARNGELDREISPQNRTRYSWDGPDDPEVKKILKKIKSGDIEKARDEQLQKLKEQKAAKKATAETPTKGKGKKAAAPPPDDDDELEELEDED